MRQYLCTPIVTVFLCINIAWGINYKDPHLLFIRGIELPVFFLSITTLLGITFFHRPHKLRIITVFCVAVLSGLIVFKEYQYRRAHERILTNDANNYTKINRRFIIGFNNKEEIKRLAENGIAGIFLTKRNIQGETFSSLRRFIRELQEIRRKSKLAPLIIATDQEGGPVSRLSPIVKRQEALSIIHKKNQSSFDYGKEQGRLLNELGITVNFSPVVDIKPDLPPGKLDFHSLIAARAISSAPREIIAVALPYIKGLRESGVTATLKHFPGLSRVQTDTHHFSASLDTDIITLKNSDWLPFIELAEKTDSWLMLSHLILEKVDSVNPVSTSKKVIDDLLRTKMEIDNVLVTDDLTMGATYNRGFCDSIIQSYSTSVDYLLIAYDYEKYIDAVNCIETRSKPADRVNAGDA